MWENFGTKKFVALFNPHYLRLLLRSVKNSHYSKFYSQTTYWKDDLKILHNIKVCTNEDRFMQGFMVYLYDHQSKSSRSKHSHIVYILHFQSAIFVYVCKYLSSDIQKGNFTSLILPTLYARYNLCRNRKWLMQMHFWEWKSIITVNRLVIKGLTTEKSRLELFFVKLATKRCV